MNFKITGTGSYIPNITKKNSDFLNKSFIDDNGQEISIPNSETINKFSSITGIVERRYADIQMNSSDIGTQAAKNAIKNSEINPEELDYIICSHNFGDVNYGSNNYDMMPSLASRIKSNLKIKNPNSVCYDIICGCPGWVESMIQAKALISSKMASKCLIIAAETLSRVIDHHDRDSMIFGDGAGAAILEKKNEKGGIISHVSATHTFDGEKDLLFVGKSNNKNLKGKFIKMQGRKVYEFALKNVPQAMKNCLEIGNININDLKKIFIHQANKKMDDAIIKRFYKLYETPMPKNVMPMNIEHYGNSSVATVPTLFDEVIKNNKNGHSLNDGDIILFASVGAGMNINAISYQI